MWLPTAAPGISASPSEDNMRYFNVMILGPTQSPYEGSMICCLIYVIRGNCCVWTGNMECVSVQVVLLCVTLRSARIYFT